MFHRTADAAFRRYRTTGDPAALARVFDRTAPELLKLARHLATREATAEDLLQATFVTVLESSDDHDGERPILPWLCGVLANHARAARRRAARGIDAARLPADRIEDPIAAATHAELREGLARGIERLPEPYRPVLRLHLEHGFEPHEIARTLERPAGTVRAQLARGLDRLRRHLPAGVAGVAAAAVTAPGRGLAAVRRAVLERAGVTGGTAATTVTLGVLAMTTKTKLVSAALLGAALLTWLAWDRAPDLPSPRSPDDDVAPARAAGIAATPDEAAAPLAGVARTEVAPRNDSAPVDESSGRAITVRLVHAGGERRPVRGATIRLQELGRLQDLSGLTSPARTDADGEVRFVDPPPGQLLVLVERAGSVRAIESPTHGESFVEAELARGVDVTGVVVDDAGIPVAGATVLVHGAVLEPTVLARCDDQGRFAASDIASGHSLVAHADGLAASLAHPVAGEPGATLALELRLDQRARRVGGRVLDPDGAPLGDALVLVAEPGPTAPDDATRHRRPVFARAAADGSFALDAPRGVELLVVAVPPDRASLAPGRAVVFPGAADVHVDVFVRRGAIVEGRVVHGSDVPVGAHVNAWPTTPIDDIGWLLNVVGLRMAPIDTDGAYRLLGLVPGEYLLSVYGAQGKAQDERTIAEGETVRWDVDLAAGLSITARVEPATPPDARLVPRWNAKLFRSHPSGDREFVTLMVTDEDGVVRFGNLGPGEYEIEVGVTGTSDGVADLVVATADRITPGVLEHGVRVEPARLPSASVRGRLVDGDGAPVAHRALLALGNGAAGGSHCRTSTGTDGRFAFPLLVPGDWTILLDPARGGPLAAARALTADEARALGDVVVR